MTSTIHVDRISKRYRIGQLGPRGASQYRTLQETLIDAVKAPIRRLANPSLSGKIEDFWALRDVSFDVEPGEVVGIVGRNGAGKSTLLKVLTRITEPSEGRAELRGRVGSLLEVGTGFHPELNGRENIFLNGAIMGMTRGEIRRAFDQIVDFSGVEQFLSTPVKRYSSGMRVRLAFSVAAHLNPEILLIDEVLAVGDAGFQRKCLGKMGDVARSGRTVLFVSHNMAALQNLCTRGVLIEGGRLMGDGAISQVISQYLGMFESTGGSRDLTDATEGRRGTGDARFGEVELLSTRGEPVSSIFMGEGLTIRAQIHATRPIQAGFVAYNIYNDEGVRLFALNCHVMQQLKFDLDGGRTASIECRIPKLNLSDGLYRISLDILDAHYRGVDQLEQAVSFEVLRGDVYGTGRSTHGKTAIYVQADWQIDAD
ncbi:MAG: ABC transporter ATP-binding protein [Pirellulales bacterium]